MPPPPRRPPPRPSGVAAQCVCRYDAWTPPTTMPFVARRAARASATTRAPRPRPGRPSCSGTRGRAPRSPPARPGGRRPHVALAVAERQPLCPSHARPGTTSHIGRPSSSVDRYNNPPHSARTGRPPRANAATSARSAALSRQLRAEDLREAAGQQQRAAALRQRGRRRSGRRAPTRPRRRAAARGSPRRRTRTRGREATAMRASATRRRVVAGSGDHASPLQRRRAARQREQGLQVDAARARPPPAGRASRRACASRSSDGTSPRWRSGTLSSGSRRRTPSTGTPVAAIASRSSSSCQSDATRLSTTPPTCRSRVERREAVDDRGDRARHRARVDHQHDGRAEQLGDLRGRGQLAAAATRRRTAPSRPRRSTTSAPARAVPDQAAPSTRGPHMNASRLRPGRPQCEAVVRGVDEVRADLERRDARARRATARPSARRRSWSCPRRSASRR